MNKTPLWKTLLVLIALLLSVLVSLPNFYGEDPALQISTEQQTDAELTQLTETVLGREGVSFTSATREGDYFLVRFPSTESQLRAVDLMEVAVGEQATVALTTAPRMPDWLAALGLRPMNLGLDLRGGVHFQLEVDMQAAVKQALERYEGDVRALLRDARIRYASATLDGQQIRILLRDASDVDAATKALRAEFPRLDIDRGESPDGAELRLTVTEQRIREIRDAAIQQNTTTIRNRVDELGVAEPLVQRQGQDRIVVQLPGVQDTARAKKIISATATVEFRLLAERGDPMEAERTGRVPPDAKLYRVREDGRPILLSRDIIVTGDQLTDASSAFDQNNQPAVSVTLDSQGGRRMLETTQANLGKPMAVVFLENRPYTVMVDGEPETRFRTVEEVISVATIQGVFSSRFQITGLAPAEARNLALLLRSGSLAAPINIVEERTIGPSLGQDNIDQGVNAVIYGMLLVVVFMAVYYRAFGLVADIALLSNLVLMVAILSLLQATLTLPGIAGIVLTLGMAVDANVLIFERIREELRAGQSAQAAIAAGYDRALSSIADANITTLIAGLVLFVFGTGPVKGFAVTLSIGILTSMFTAVVVTRVVVNNVIGRRRLNTLWI